eukprot:scaffold8075_cov115-Isochrysis_galbana.AAC.1
MRSISCAERRLSSPPPPPRPRPRALGGGDASSSLASSIVCRIESPARSLSSRRAACATSASECRPSVIIAGSPNWE